MNPTISVSGLQKSFTNKTVVKGLSFNVNQGEIFSILGPNGAGKTTTLDCMVGLKEPDNGEITLLGYSPKQNEWEELRSCLSLFL